MPKRHQRVVLVLAGHPFGGYHGAQGETAAALGLVGYGDAVNVGIPAYDMCAGHLAYAFVADSQLVGIAGLLVPALYAAVAVHDALGQRDGGAARVVELMHMMYLLHLRSVGVKRLHQRGQIAVKGEEYVDAEAEIGGPEKCGVLLAAYLLDFAEPGRPARGAAHHLDTPCKSAQIVVKSRMRRGELNGHIGRAESLGVEVAGIVNINNTTDLMSAGAGYLFDCMAHLAIPYKCYFHLIMNYYKQ